MSLEYPKFELISKYNDTNLIPKRATTGSAGYDFVVAEDIEIPSYLKLSKTIATTLQFAPL